MNILSPNFIDFNLDFKKESFLNLAKLSPISGGISPLVYLFEDVNWIKPSAFNRSYNDTKEAYFIDVGDGIKRTAVNYELSELCIDDDFIHVMYGDYFKLRVTEKTILSVDFAGLACREHVEEILSISNVRYVFCSDHDLWADNSYLTLNSRNRLIIWHSPECVRFYIEQSMYTIPNDRFIQTKKIVVGAGDLLAISIMRQLYEKSFEELNPDYLIQVITGAMNFVSDRFYS